MSQGSEMPGWIEVSLQVSPSAERIEDAFLFFGINAVRKYSGQG
jgi:hypothetical protein